MSDRKFKTIKHHHEHGDFHELTFSCYRKMRLLTNDSWRRELSLFIQMACEEEQIDLVAFVFMPDHVHLLVFPLTNKPDMGRFLSKIKQPYSATIRRQLELAESPLLKKLMIRERPDRNAFRFWQEGPGCDRNLFQPKTIQASIAYLHRNPVRAKLCKRALDWQWSSARFYLGDPPQQQFDELPHIHGLRPEALDDGPSRH